MDRGKVPRPALHGNKVNVTVEEMDGGNYTCHLSTDGQYLNHTLVLVQLDPDNMTVILEKTKHRHHGEESHIHCSGRNYNGSFHCTWKRTHSRSKAAVILVKAERNFQEIACDLDADGSGVHCQDPSCPYKEEQHHISITVYIHSISRLEAYTNSFYLREIVRPERLPNLRNTEEGVFSWDYPDSWDKPCTYFGLQFGVKVVSRGETCHSNKTISIETPDTTEENSYTLSVKRKKYVFCVRARDKYTQGPWSEWSYMSEYEE
ncbi:interleukin-12 subunit beta [Diretmus argenteus]